MTPLIVIGILTGTPILLILLLRANAAIVFLSLCTGSVLTQFVSADAVDMYNSFQPHSGDVAESAVKLVLLFLPALLTIVFLRGGVSGSKQIFNILPAAATGVVAVLLAVPLLAPGLRYSITGSNTWLSVEQFQGVIVGAGVLVSMLLLWVRQPKHGKDKKRH